MARQVIDLKVLAQAHSDEIDRMADAIRGGQRGRLWTAEMPAITRGGKCGTVPAQDEPDSI